MEVSVVYRSIVPFDIPLAVTATSSRSSEAAFFRISSLLLEGIVSGLFSRAHVQQLRILTGCASPSRCDSEHPVLVATFWPTALANFLSSKHSPFTSIGTARRVQSCQ